MVKETPRRHWRGFWKTRGFLIKSRQFSVKAVFGCQFLPPIVGDKTQREARCSDMEPDPR